MLEVVKRSVLILADELALRVKLCRAHCVSVGLIGLVFEKRVRGSDDRRLLTAKLPSDTKTNELNAQLMREDLQERRPDTKLLIPEFSTDQLITINKPSATHGSEYVRQGAAGLLLTTPAKPKVVGSKMELPTDSNRRVANYQREVI